MTLLRRLLTALALAFPALAGAADDASGGWQKIFDLLPPGSELKGVMLPRYDENHTLTAVLKSQSVILVDATRVTGREVSFELFNPDQSPKGRIDMVNATIYQKSAEDGLISTRDPVVLKSERLHATGSGLYYAFGKKSGFLHQGFLLGPGTTTLKLPTKKP